MEDASIPPSAIFNVIFGEYNFSIISNLFDSSDPSALGMHKSKICEQDVSCLVKDSELGAKKLHKVCRNDYSKSTKMAITASKFSRGACPRTPLEPYFVFQYASN